MVEFAGRGAGQVLGKRAEQQDAFAFGHVVLADGRRAALAVLADGMGGHDGGAVASHVAVETFLHHAGLGSESSFTDALSSSLLAANRAISVEGRDNPRLGDMGCTIVAAALDGPMLHYVSVGDSVLWKVSLGELERLNADHSMTPLVDAAVARGEMTEEEARNLRSGLRSALTGRPIQLIDSRSIELGSDDDILLASDGILTLSDAAILSLVNPLQPGDRQARVDALLDAVEEHALPDQDNCTVMLVSAQGGSAAKADRRRWTFSPLAWGALLGGLIIAGAAAYQINQSVGFASLLDRPEIMPTPSSDSSSAADPSEVAEIPAPAICEGDACEARKKVQTKDGTSPKSKPPKKEKPEPRPAQAEQENAQKGGTSDHEASSSLVDKDSLKPVPKAGGANSGTGEAAQQSVDGKPPIAKPGGESAKETAPEQPNSEETKG